jgi:hypothetical protein
LDAIQRDQHRSSCCGAVQICPISILAWLGLTPGQLPDLIITLIFRQMNGFKLTFRFRCVSSLTVLFRQTSFLHAHRLRVYGVPCLSSDDSCDIENAVLAAHDTPTPTSSDTDTSSSTVPSTSVTPTVSRSVSKRDSDHYPAKQAIVRHVHSRASSPVPSHPLHPLIYLSPSQYGCYTAIDCV